MAWPWYNQVGKDGEGKVNNMSNKTKYRPFLMQTSFEYVLVDQCEELYSFV